MRVTPLLACARCTATVRVRVALRNVRPGAQSVRVTGTFGSRRIDLGTRGIPGNGVTSLQHQLQDGAPARVVARGAQPLQRQPAGERGRARRRLVQAAHGHPLDPRLRRRASDPQRRAREPPRRRRARGLEGPGLRGRQRVPHAARRRDQGGRRDDDAHALPDAPVHARAGRPRGRDDLVRGPGLRDQDREPRQEPRDDAGGEGAREEHHRQPEPPVGADLVDRQRALLAPRPDAGRLHHERRPPGQAARPEPPGRPRRRRLPGGRLPEQGLRAARRDRLQRVLRLVPRPAGLDLRPHAAVGLPRPGSAPATRGRR